MAKFFRWGLLALIWALASGSWAGTVGAQDTLALWVRKNMGYNNGSQIQGNFRVEVTGPANLAAVTYKIDEVLLGTATTPPFKINFSTENYAAGWHTFTAEAQTADGRTLQASAKRYEFVTSAQAWQETQKIMLPMLVLGGGIMVLVLGGQVLLAFSAKNKPPLPLGAPRQYGLWGGAICPRCQRPFAIHWWGLNALTGKFDRCDHCGRWSLVQAAPREKLAAAEAAEALLAQAAPPAPASSAEEKLRHELDNSRFLDP